MTSPWEEGDPNAPICILGEAPGRSEMAARRPLVGPAGKLFDTCLTQAGIARRQCYILNVFPYTVTKKGDALFRPDGECVYTPKSGFMYFEAVETANRLMNCKSNVFVPLGGTALDFMTNKSQIMKWRGSILKDAVLRKAVPTIHPAASLRGQYIWRYLIINDLRRAKEESLDPEIHLPEREFVTARYASEACDYLNSAREVGKPIATDIEGINHQVACFSVSNSPDFAFCIPLMGPDGPIFSEVEETAIWEDYAKLCADPRIMKVNQNILFDMSALWQKNRIEFKGPIGDTMVAHSIMYPEFPKGLDMIASLNTREPYWKDEGKLWENPGAAGAADWEEFYVYNCKDSAVTLECWHKLAQEMEEGGYRELHDQTVAMYPTLLYMMARGLKVDEARLYETRERIKQEIVTKRAELLDVADHAFNPTSPKQCQEYFYKHKGITPYIHRKTRKPTTDDTALSRIWRRHHLPEAKLVQEIRNLEKLEGTYLEIRYDDDRRLRCSYNPRGTWTGRLSSSQTIWGTGTNMQNLDPRFKGFLVAG